MAVFSRKAFLHTSTTYTNTDYVVLDEVIYPPPGDWNWRTMIQAVEELDDRTLLCLTPKIQGNRPNTYTFSKALTEQVVRSFAEKLPVTIYRPSVVISSMEEPIAGWTDSFNGPIGLLAGLGTGVMRTIYADPDARMDYVPVDVVIKGMVVAVWDKANQKETKPKVEEAPLVYNCAVGLATTMSLKQMCKTGLDLSREEPFENVLWYPNVRLTRHKAVFYLNVILYHLLPALVVDAVMKLMGKKPMMFRLHRRIFVMNTAVGYFWHREWIFTNNHATKLDQRIAPGDRKDWSFYIPPEEVNIEDNSRSMFTGAKKYLLKEKNTISRSKLKDNLQRMYWINQTIRCAVIMLLTWTALSSSWIHQAALTLAAFNFTTLQRAYGCCMGFIVLHTVL